MPSCVSSVIRLADAEIQTHHVKNAGEHCTWDESVRFCPVPCGPVRPEHFLLAHCVCFLQFSFNNVAPDDVVEFHVSRPVLR